MSACKPTIILPRPLVNQLLTEAQKSPGAEVCGLIGRANADTSAEAEAGAGTSNNGSHCYPISNVATDPAHAFLLDAAEQVDAMRRMRERDEELYAIYHSHPDAPAYPSPTDQRLAAYPGVLYLIISLDITGVLQMRGFQLAGEQIDEVALEV